MSRLIWAPQALRDVQRLFRFLAERDLNAAQRAVQVIRQEVKVLEKQPAIGRPMQDMEPEYREWLIDFGDSGYVALYRLAGEEVVILAVRHQREVGY